MLNPNLIKLKSKELDIPFDNLLVGCCLEDLVVFISEHYFEELWIINDKTLGLSNYKRGISDSLDNNIGFSLHINKMVIPVFLIIQKLGNLETFPREKSLMLSLENAKTVHYMEYPLEEKIAELLFDILDKLELIGDLREYIDLYDILRTETVEGRKVIKVLSGKCANKNGFDSSRLEQLASYGDYTHMRKRWKKVIPSTGSMS